MNTEKLFNSQYRLPIVISLLVILAVVVTLLSGSVTRIGESPVLLVMAPSDAVANIDGVEFGNGTHYITPGTYEITITRPDFITYEGTFEVIETNNELDNILTVPLEPGPNVSSDFLDQAQLDQYLTVEGFGGISAQREGQRFIDENPVVEVLPYQDDLVQIDFRQNQEEELILVVTGQTEALNEQAGAFNAAREALNVLNHDFDQYKSEFAVNHRLVLEHTDANFTINYIRNNLEDAQNPNAVYTEFRLEVLLHPTSNNTWDLSNNVTEAQLAAAREEAEIYILSKRYKLQDLIIDYRTPDEAQGVNAGGGISEEQPI